MIYQFESSDAKQFGQEEAVMLWNFRFWIMKNKATGKHFHDGRTWTYCSIEAFEELFEWWTVNQIRRIINSLVSQGVIMTGNYNKVKYDRTLWYAFCDESKFSKTEIHFYKTTNGSEQNHEPIPDIYTDKDTDTQKPSAGKPAAGKKAGEEKQPSAVAEVRQAFKDAGAKFYFDAKQAKQCKLLYARYKSDPDYFLSMIKTFIGLQRTDKWYAKQPCSPAMLNSLWDRIELELRKTPPPSSAAPPPLDDEERSRFHRMKLSAHGFDTTKMTDDDALYFSGILDGLKREWMDEWSEHIPDHLRRYYVGSPG